MTFQLLQIIWVLWQNTFNLIVFTCYFCNYKCIWIWFLWFPWSRWVSGIIFLYSYHLLKKKYSFKGSEGWIVGSWYFDAKTQLTDSMAISYVFERDSALPQKRLLLKFIFSFKIHKMLFTNMFGSQYHSLFAFQKVDYKFYNASTVYFKNEK